MFNLFLACSQVVFEGFTYFVMLLGKFLPLGIVLDKHDVFESGGVLIPLFPQLVHIVLEASVVLVQVVHQVRVCIALSLAI